MKPLYLYQDKHSLQFKCETKSWQSIFSETLFFIPVSAVWHSTLNFGACLQPHRFSIFSYSVLEAALHNTLHEGQKGQISPRTLQTIIWSSLVPFPCTGKSKFLALFCLAVPGCCQHLLSASAFCTELHWVQATQAVGPLHKSRQRLAATLSAQIQFAHCLKKPSLPPHSLQIEQHAFLLVPATCVKQIPTLLLYPLLILPLRDLLTAIHLLTSETTLAIEQSLSCIAVRQAHIGCCNRDSRISLQSIAHVCTENMHALSIAVCHTHLFSKIWKFSVILVTAILEFRNWTLILCQLRQDWAVFPIFVNRTGMQQDRQPNSCPDRFDALSVEARNTMWLHMCKCYTAVTFCSKPVLLSATHADAQQQGHMLAPQHSTSTVTHLPLQKGAIDQKIFTDKTQTNTSTEQQKEEIFEQIWWGQHCHTE